MNTYDVVFWSTGNATSLTQVVGVDAYTAADAVCQVEVKLTAEYGKGNFIIREVRPVKK